MFHYFLKKLYKQKFLIFLLSFSIEKHNKIFHLCIYMHIKQASIFNIYIFNRIILKRKQVAESVTL